MSTGYGVSWKYAQIRVCICVCVYISTALQTTAYSFICIAYSLEERKKTKRKCCTVPGNLEMEIKMGAQNRTGKYVPGYDRCSCSCGHRSFAGCELRNAPLELGGQWQYEISICQVRCALGLESGGWVRQLVGVCV
jgi:hypothetical protein